MSSALTKLQPYEHGPLIEAYGHYAVLRHILSLEPTGTALEFGVGSGESTRIIAQHMPVVGFDSFDGLPEDWRAGFPKGTFACEIPRCLGAAQLEIGLFEDTLPESCWDDIGFIGLVHIDCDLYSSTKAVLDNIGLRLEPGAYVVFDEFWGYDDGPGMSYRDHEQRAWREFADSAGIAWRVIGHWNESWGIQIV